MKLAVNIEIEAPLLWEKIKQARKEAKKTGYNVRQLAQLAGIHRAYWYKLEKPVLGNALAVETLLKIKKALAVAGVNLEIEEELKTAIQSSIDRLLA